MHTTAISSQVREISKARIYRSCIYHDRSALKKGGKVVKMHHKKMLSG